MTEIPTLLTGVVLGWLVLALAVLIYRLARRNLRRSAAVIDHSVALVTFGRKMTSALDHASLAHLLMEEIPQAFMVHHATLLLPESYYLVNAGPDEMRLPINHAAVRWVASGGEAQKANRGQLAELIRQGPESLAWTQVWVPLMRGVDLRGLWLLGARKGGRGYIAEDLHCFTTLGREAAAVLEATRHTEQQRQIAAEMRSLYHQVVTAREQEQGRLSRELHDGVLQDLCAVTRDLKSLAAQSNTGDANIDPIAQRAGETVNALRAICTDLRPPLLQRNLKAALYALVEAMDARSPAPVHIEISANDLTALPGETALTIFRITQEALNNALQHADASEIAVRLTQYPDTLRLTVTDDGRGIRETVDLANFVAWEHFGLAGMRERATMVGGTLDVQTAVDYGTVIVLEIPCASDA